MSLLDYASDELMRAGLFDPDSDYDGALGKAVLELIRVFADQGHSGFSASMALKLFDKLAKYEPLTPLTGDDAEWLEVGEQDGQPLYQNRRCGRIFKCGDQAYDIEGRIFREPSGVCYTGYDSRVPVTFPCVPVSVYVDVPDREEEIVAVGPLADALVDTMAHGPGELLDD